MKHWQTVSIKFWEASDYPDRTPSSVGRQGGCAWGGSTPSNCQRHAEYTLRGEDANWAACSHHMEMFVRNKLRRAAEAVSHEMK